MVKYSTVIWKSRHGGWARILRGCGVVIIVFMYDITGVKFQYYYII